MSNHIPDPFEHAPVCPPLSVEAWEYAARYFFTDILPGLRCDVPGAPQKVPCFMSSSGKIRYIYSWGVHTTTQRDYLAWSRDPRVNIHMKHESIYCFDVDVYEDVEFSESIVELIQSELGVRMPIRYRDNSGSRALFFKPESTAGLVGKNILFFPGETGKLEFRGRGCQTVWDGCHESGSEIKHIQLEGGFPTVSNEKLIALWDLLCERFEDSRHKPIDSSQEIKHEAIIRNGAYDKDDPLLRYLSEEGWLLQSYPLQGGKFPVRCPSEATHSTRSTISTTTYFPVGTGGMGLPGFKCMHANCAHITTDKFKDLIGYTAREQARLLQSFEVEPHPMEVVRQLQVSAPKVLDLNDSIELAVTVGKAAFASAVNLDVDPKTRKLKPTLANLSAFLGMTQVVHIKRDAFLAQTLVRLGGVGEYKRLTDEVVTATRLIAERAFGVTFTHQEMSRQLDLASHRNQFDSAKDWINTLEWDGQDRLTDFSRDILKAVDTEYSKKLGWYMFTAMAARILQPGCKADIAPILLSPRQGTGKSSLVARLAPFPDWFGTVDLTHDDSDIYRLLRGKMVVELPELRGLSGREAGATKALITQQVDSWVPKYMEHEVSIPRRVLFVGTDNRTRFLTDATGNRRFAPIRVAQTASFIDWPLFTEERDQYYAQAKEWLSDFGTPEIGLESISAKLRQLAEPFTHAATVLDPWLKKAEDVLELQEQGAEMTLEALCVLVTGRGTESIDMHKANRLRIVMLQLGHEELEPDVWRIQKSIVI